ncbi:phage holin family protein [Clostridium perfringens]|uniref:phage holin family protein n=1 Tax=Clostridium perfringens TaxID=1502 RepID=UPI00103C32A9|nr:phage holin family protein [Clostridium perfringens]EGT0692555.1 phage holin family protein [Clostridium perfringens]EHK2335532.1 phage holin family protein [Clostridium perfringens]EIL8447610.1 phage holin family protein [Clostridium perfringens]ELC8381111.1 phage holin family protein [Clostridium perfringens]MBO3376657.1 phage holin family protein [Clostridium perfringens]
MKRIISNFFINLVVVLILIYLFNLGEAKSVLNIVLFSVIFTILGFTLRPILQIISLPITVLTFGIFLFLVNEFIVYIADIFTIGFNISGFLNNLIVSIVLFIVSFIVNKYRLKIKIEKINKTV